jgi:hypothetical protein
MTGKTELQLVKSAVMPMRDVLIRNQSTVGEPGYLADGYATPVRGKSRTCRRATRPDSPVYDRREYSGQRPADEESTDRQVQDLPRTGVAKPLGVVRLSGE